MDDTSKNPATPTSKTSNPKKSGAKLWIIMLVIIVIFIILLVLAILFTRNYYNL